jgi:hypothetical protein
MIILLGTILYAGAVWLLLRANHRAHRKPTPTQKKAFDILELEKLWRSR